MKLKEFIMDEVEDGHTIDRMSNAVEYGMIGVMDYERMTLQEMREWLEDKEEV